MQPTLAARSQKLNLLIFLGIIFLLILSSFFTFKYDLNKKRGEIIAYIDDSAIYSNEITAKIEFLHNLNFNTAPEETQKILLKQELNQKLILQIAKNQNWQIGEDNHNTQYIKSENNFTDAKQIVTPPWYKLMFFTEEQYGNLQHKLFLQEKKYVSAYLENLKAEYFLELKENILSNNQNSPSNKQLIKLHFQFKNKRNHDLIYEQLVAQEKIFNKQLKFLKLKELTNLSFHKINNYLDPNFSYAIAPSNRVGSSNLEILIPLKHTDLLANDLFEHILLRKAELILKDYISESSNRIKILF